MHDDAIQFCVNCRRNTLKIQKHILGCSLQLQGQPRAACHLVTVLGRGRPVGPHRGRAGSQAGTGEGVGGASSSARPALSGEGFSQTSHWAPEPALRGSDASLGRIHLEFRNWTPTMLDVGRRRSMAHFIKTATRGQMDILGVKDAHRLRSILLKYTILANTWVVGGCFRVSDGSLVRAVIQPLARSLQARSLFAHSLPATVGSGHGRVGGDVLVDGGRTMAE